MTERVIALDHEIIAEVWILLDKTGKEYAFAIGRTPKELYEIAGVLMGGEEAPYSKQQLNNKGYKAENVLLVRVKP